MKQAAWILGDQLSLKNSALQQLNSQHDVVIMVESLEHARELNHHKAKLLLCFSAMRHFREELREMGYTVCYDELAEGKNFLEGLRTTVKAHNIKRLFVMAPHEIATVRFAASLSQQLNIDVVLTPNTMFLTDRDAFVKKHKGKKHLIMENYYREMRKKFGVLMQDGKPVGGAWNYDKDNRQSAKAFAQSKLKIPPIWTPEKDAIDKEVEMLVEKFFPNNIGTTEHFRLPTKRIDAERFLDDFIKHRLAHFGDFEDTMLQNELIMFHAVISPLINIGLIEPMQCVEKAISEYENRRAPLNSVEGFVRQIIGWREFIYGCYWVKMSEGDYHEENYFNHQRPLPDFYWTGETKMNCLSNAIKKVLKFGYTHHIERLMVLGNFALLAGVQPKQINRWFWEFYLDAYDWVVTPNVIGMSQFADGGFVATKPYCSGAAYIDKMSDYCKSCAFSTKEKTGENACPFNYLYWDFLMRNEEKLRPNNRITMIYGTLDRKSDSEKRAIRRSAETFLAGLNPNTYYA
ncbi:MAG: cryptochrome/photolyase family protein [Chloroherpetonaceae bacterium]